MLERFKPENILIKQVNILQESIVKLHCAPPIALAVFTEKAKFSRQLHFKASAFVLEQSAV